jgi:chromosome partitioning protein
LQSSELDLASPLYKPLVGADMDNPTAQAYEDALLRAVDELRPTSDFIVIDCPGSHTRKAQVAHCLADTLITPLNDSFVDFDLLAKVDNDGEKIIGPSVYSEMVWSARQKRAQAGQAPIDWVVLRNRLGAQQMVNKLKLEKAIDRLAKRIGFRVSPGFSERVIFRELFPRGLTLLDLKDTGVKQLNISNVAARQELRELIKTLNLPDVQINF